VASIPIPRHAEPGEPPGELREPAERRSERPRLLVNPPTAGAGHTDCGNHVIAVHVKASAPLYKNIHHIPPFVDRYVASSGGGLPR